MKIQSNVVLLLPASLFLLSLSPDNGFSRQTILIGSLKTSAELWNREYDTKPDEVEESDTEKHYWSLTPGLSMISAGLHNTVSIRYSPSLKYDSNSDYTDINHAASIKGSLAATQYWSIVAGDQFLYSDDPNDRGKNEADQETDTEDNQLSEDEQESLSSEHGRSRYWSNRANISTSFQYAQNSRFQVGYSYQILRYDDDNSNLVNLSNDYDKHNWFSSVTHTLNRSWGVGAKCSYAQGDFDDSVTINSDDEDVTESIDDLKIPNRDVEEYHTSANINYQPTSIQSIGLDYRHQETKYKDDENQDSTINDLTTRWGYSFDTRTKVSLSGGVSYIEIEEQSELWDYNGSASLSKSFQHASLGASASKGYHTNNFSGTDNYGVTDTYTARLNGSYQATQNLSFSANVSYQYQENLTPQGERKTDRGDDATVENTTDSEKSYDTSSYQGGLGAKYSFREGLSGSLQYSYSKHTGDLDRDTYADHRFMIQLSGTMEILRW